MNKQTALQQLNDWVQQEYTSNNRIRLAALIGKIKELQMTTEKEQRIKDYNSGWEDGACNHINDAENYVNESNYINGE